METEAEHRFPVRPVLRSALVAILILIRVWFAAPSLSRGTSTNCWDAGRSFTANAGVYLSLHVSAGGGLPGTGVPPDENAFPELYEEVLRSIRADWNPREFLFVPGEEGLVRASDEQLDDPTWPKYLVDQYGNPIWYRVRDGRAELWCTGPDGKSDPFGESSDDSVRIFRFDPASGPLPLDPEMRRDEPGATTH